MGRLLAPMAVCLAVVAGQAADLDDPIATKLATAKGRYKKELSAAKADLAEELKKKANGFRNAGDLNGLERVEAEVEGLWTRGDLPKSVPTKTYEAALRSPRTRLGEAYLAAVKAYTRADKRAEAKAVQAEYDDFQQSGPDKKPGATAELFLYYSDATGDHFTTAGEADVTAAKGAKFRPVRALGSLSQNKQPGTVPLSLYVHPVRGEFASAATPAAVKVLKEAGYKFVRTQGYLSEKETEGTRSVNLYFHAGRKDFWLTVGDADKKEAEDNDYKPLGVQGYAKTPKGN